MSKAVPRFETGRTSTRWEPVRSLWGRRWRVYSAAMALLLLLGWLTSPSVLAQTVQLDTVLSGGITRPVAVRHAGDGSDRLFVLEKCIDLGNRNVGRVRIVDNGSVLPVPFLEVDPVSCANEQGLLGLAFHPSYASNGVFFVHYTDAQGSNVVDRHTVSGNPDVANSAGQLVFSTSQPYTNHNGGDLAFGPDGYLYLSLGDGGSGGDPLGHGQDPGTFLGTILRLDVDSASPYAVPPSNPFVTDPNALDEIWAFGLRNPWRFSFDRLNGDLFIGDVGQGSWEEIDRAPAGDNSGPNFGWKRYEGTHCFSAPCSTAGLVPPIVEYGHGLGCSVTGGYVYRGRRSGRLAGAYIYGDYCSGRIWAARRGRNGLYSAQLLIDTSLRISSFGETEDGEILVVDYRSNGALLHLNDPGALFFDGFETGDTMHWAP